MESNKQTLGQYLETVKKYGVFAIAILGYFQQFPAIFGDFQQLEMFCKFWNPTKNLKTLFQFSTKLWLFLVISGHFGQFLAVFSNFWPFLAISG